MSQRCDGGVDNFEAPGPTNSNSSSKLENALAAMQYETERFMVIPSSLQTITQGGNFPLPYHVQAFLQVDNYAYQEELACKYHAVVI